MSENDVEQQVGDGSKDGERAFTEITDESYCEKMQRSCGGSVAGLILFLVSFVLLVWNEGRTVKRAQDIDEGRQVVLTIDDIRDLNNATIRSNYDQALVYLTGELTTADPLYDPIFGVGAVPSSSASDTQLDDNATNNENGKPTTTTNNDKTSSSSSSPLKLARYVEMYQWVEQSTSRTQKTSSGGTRTITEYTYDTQWSRYLIDSSTFKEQSSTTSRVNPTQFPFPATSWIADPILLEDVLVLQEPAVARLNWFEPVPQVSMNNVPDETLAQRLQPYGSSGFFYSSTFHNTTSSNASPRVGDTRITFAQVPASTISIIAGYTASSSGLGNYVTEGGRYFLLLQQGTFTEEELFTQADNENTTVAWVLRFVGFILMVIGILLVLQPLADAVDIIPFVGDCLQGGMERFLFPVIAFLIALPLSLFTIALAWLVYRPMWSVPILVGSAGILICLCMRTKKVVGNSGGHEEEEFKPSVPSSPYTSSGANGGGAFANALDNPTNPSYGKEEAEIPVASEEPYVPQVYKPYQ